MTDQTAQNVIDVAVIGAGFSGLYILHRFRQLGLRTEVYERGHGVGGTWYWNRYPGAGSDIESLEYSYAFDEDLQQEWEWKERYASQPELEAYLQHVAERFDLLRDIRFGMQVEGMRWLEDRKLWQIGFHDGSEVLCRFCVVATGLLSAPKHVDIAGLEDFSGRILHTSSWPHEEIDFSGRAVGIIGTGSTAVQAIPVIAKQAKTLTVFQRTPNFSAPRNNGSLQPDYVRRVKSDYRGWRQKQMNSFGGYVSVDFHAMEPNPNNARDMTPEQRRAEYEFRWKSGGLSFYTSFKDLLFDPEMNEELAEFFREKIRARINDPAVADLLIPRSYPILTKRLCADSNYYETYNRDNVKLVDISTTGISRLVESGVQTGDTVHRLDDVIFALGFDAVTGAAVRIDIRGRDGLTLADAWRDGPHTNAGLMTHGFPNLLFVNGPGSCTGFFNPVLNVQYQGDWFADMISHMQKNGFEAVESTVAADDVWTGKMADIARPTLFWNSSNWYVGSNIPGKPQVMQLYLGGFTSYRDHTTGVAASGYPGFDFK